MPLSQHIACNRACLLKTSAPVEISSESRSKKQDSAGRFSTCFARDNERNPETRHSVFIKTPVEILQRVLGGECNLKDFAACAALNKLQQRALSHLFPIGE